jgi:DNA-binding NtrC family response regulator
MTTTRREQTVTRIGSAGGTPAVIPGPKEATHHGGGEIATDGTPTCPGCQSAAAATPAPPPSDATRMVPGDDPYPYHTAIRAFRRALVTHALQATGGNRARAARALGLQRTYLQRLIRELGVQVPPSATRRA